MTVKSWKGDLGTGVLVHGGAGNVDPARAADHIEGCRQAARAGHTVLLAGGDALAAVQVAARVLEDLPQFNAGHGAALNEDGEVEHDAALMEGAGLRAGAVAALTGFKNPIDAARAVLDDGRHVLLVGEGAALLAIRAQLVRIDPAELVTAQAREALVRVQAGRGSTGWAGGTIGAVARDARGSVAAATSTGGTVGKRRGRIGDSPILGAGTLADDASCAVSVTGDGEAILRIGVARAIALAIEGGQASDVAASAALERMLRRTAGRGGVILIDPRGHYALSRSTSTMSWAVAGEKLDDAGI